MPASGRPSDLIVTTPEGLYCPSGDFHIDPWRPVERAVISHAHADHGCRGCSELLASADGRALVEHRFGGKGTNVTSVGYGERITLKDAAVSLHPAGHVLGSVQVRVEHAGRIWTFSGDYATAHNPTCRRFEPVRCDRFISECTFGLPVYRWAEPPTQTEELAGIVQAILDHGDHAVIGAYALGKAQRILAMLGDRVTAPILCHGAVESINDIYRAEGVALPKTQLANAANLRGAGRACILVAPPSAMAGPWIRRFQPNRTVIASGWATTRAVQRRRSADHHLVLSDHVDWPGLIAAVDATGCREIGLTHGFTTACARWFEESGLLAETYATRFTDRPSEASEGGGA